MNLTKHTSFRRIGGLIGLCLLIAATITACTATTEANAQGDLNNTEWKLVRIGDQPVKEGVEITLSFSDDGTAGGSAGCNSYGSDYTVEGNQITFAQVVSTMMACQDEDVMKLEAEFLAALQNSESFDLQEGTLTITSTEGKTLEFVAR